MMYKKYKYLFISLIIVILVFVIVSGPRGYKDYLKNRDTTNTYAIQNVKTARTSEYMMPVLTMGEKLSYIITITGNVLLGNLSN